MRSFLVRNWFLIALLTLVPCAVALGTSASGPAIEAQTSRVPTGLVTAVVLLLMAVTLDSRQFVASLKKPGPVVLSCLVNVVVLPLLAWAAFALLASPDFRVGLLITAAVPCTMASASVWTRAAKGNDAVSLLVTLVTNTFCFVITPFWLTTIPSPLSDVGQSIELDRVMLIQRLVISVLIPILLGQSLRLARPVAEFATRNKFAIGVVAQSLILVLIIFSGVKSGVKLAGGGETPGLVNLLRVLFAGTLIHVVALWVGYAGGKALGFTLRDRIAVGIAGSQKTLPIGVLIADVVSPVFPFALFPLMLYHAMQLILDLLLANRMARWVDAEATADRSPASE